MIDQKYLLSALAVRLYVSQKGWQNFKLVWTFWYLVLKITEYILSVTRMTHVHTARILINAIFNFFWEVISCRKCTKYILINKKNLSFKLFQHLNKNWCSCTTSLSIFISPYLVQQECIYYTGVLSKK